MGGVARRSRASEGLDMSLQDLGLRMRFKWIGALALALFGFVPAVAGEGGPDLIFRQSTDFKLLTPNDKLVTYAIDDPLVEGVGCYYTVHEKGGVTGTLGLAENTSDVSLACRQYAPIKFKEKFSQGEQVFSERRSLFFKRMQIVRGCDPKRNVLVYMVYSDKLVEGSPQNSTSAVSLEPWGGAQAQRCGDFVK
jgi:CreA protein